MTKQATGPKSRLEGNNGGAPVLIDRAASLLEHADDANDVVCFWEGDLITNRFKYIERVDVPDVRALGIEEFISQRYGGGKYKAGIRNRTSGAYGSSVVVEIVGPPKSRGDRDAARGIPTAGPAAAPAGAQSGAMPGWLEKILLPIGVTAATAFGTYFAKKLLEPKGTDPVLLELVKQLGKKEPASSTPPGSPLDHVELLRSLLDLQDALTERANPGGSSAPVGESGGVAGVLERQLPALVGVLNRKLDIDDRRAMRAAQPIPPRVQAGTPPAASSGSSSSSSAEPSSATPAADALVALLQATPRIARQFLLSAAESDEAPAVYADLILGKLDDASYAEIGKLLERADFVDVFVATMPAFAEYRPWVEELAAAMRESIETAAAELGAGAESEGAPAHSGDSSSSSHE